MSRIVVGIDGSRTSKVAAEKAIGLALRLDGEVHFVTVVDAPEADEDGVWVIDDLLQARQHVENFMTEVGRGFVQHTVAAVTGEPAKALVAEAVRLDADLIVIGNADIRGLDNLVSSVAGGIAVDAPCDVLIARTTD